MALRRLQVTDFRCLPAADLEIDSSFTLISGPNAAGKTSVLEAIYVLGRGRSFRTRRLEQLIRRGSKEFVVFGEVDTASRRIPVGVEGSPDGVRARIAGVTAASLAELALALPVQIIDPEVHKLIEEGPVRRRRFLDWGVFHVEPGFVVAWQRYQQVLKQRNSSLRRRESRAMTAIWDKDLIRHGEALSAARVRYVTQLADQVRSLGQVLLGKPVDLRYRTGWSKDLSMAEALARSVALEEERGVTQVGPHRADLLVMIDGLAAKDHVSRGQQKLLAAALLIAQIKLFPNDAEIRPTLLLDDPAAELDQERLGALIHEIANPGHQLIVTSLQPEFAAFGVPGRRFLIREGRVTPA